MSDRFAATARLYGQQALERFRELHVLVVGIGGVGSWAVEALARNGVGEITLLDNDDIAESNINRQIHALTPTLGRQKVEVMAERIAQINPDCRCHPIDDLLVSNNLDDYLGRGYDHVIDAIDSIRFKADMIYWCKRNRLPIVTTGGAGGITDPTTVTVKDLTLTHNDPLAAKVRHRLRSQYGWSRNPKRRFGIECVYSTQQPVYPRGDGTVCHAKPGKAGVTLDCASGYGSTVVVTATFGMVAAARVLERAQRRGG